MRLRTRWIILPVVCVLLLGGILAFARSQHEQHSSKAAHKGTATLTTLAALQDKPRIVFRNTALGRTYGFVGMVSLRDPSGPRALTKTTCDRVYAVTRELMCLASDLGIDTQYSARILNPDLHTLQTLPLTGIPSRARLSADGTLAATTSFVSGDSYAGTSFSTRTVISKVGGKSYGSLENFRLLHDRKAIAPTGRNFWGVTFAANDDTFYATVAWANHTWLVRGSLSKRTVTTIHEDAECPSLSPDGSAIVYKQRGNLPQGQWRLVRYDVATGKVTRLAETRSINDQVEWLNNSTVIYGVPRTGAQAAVDDVWSVPADGSGKPTMLISHAWSPAVVH